MPFFPRGKEIAPLIPKLPSTLALVFDEYISEENDYLALHGLCAALEITTRFLTLIVLAEFWNRQDSPEFPEQLCKDLIQHLDRPTLGSWRHLLVSAVNALPGAKGHKECLLPELPDYMEKLVNECGSNSADPMEKLLPLRNLMAHGGRISDEMAKKLIEAHTPRFDELMSGLAFLSMDAGVKLVALPEKGPARLLCGLPPIGSGKNRLDFPEYDRSQLPQAFCQAGPDRMLLISPKGVLDLCPLHSYGEVFQIIRNERQGSDEDAMHIYSRKAEPMGIEYAALGSNASHSRGAPSWEDRFAAIFPLESWKLRYQLERDNDGDLKKYSFSERMRELLGLFIGRDAQVKAAIERLALTASGVFWLPGKPGMGKSAFMAKLVRDCLPRGKGKAKAKFEAICIPYFFQISQSDLCRISSFLEAAILQLARAIGKPAQAKSDPQERLEQFRTLMQDIAGEQTKRVIFFVDGLDEIARLEDGFINFIFSCQYPKVLWVCAGRDETALCERFTPDRCQWFFESNNGLLPPLTENNVRAYFIEELGHRLPQFFGRDKQQKDGTWSNEFVEEVINRSDGLPLYLKLLIQDIRCGNLDFSRGSEEKLPQGLDEYFGRIVKEMGNDLSATVPAVTCLLAVAQEPLPFETLAELLADHENIREGGAKFLWETLRHSNIMLSQGPTAQGQIGYTLYHGSFREHVLNNSELEFSLRNAVRRFSSLARRWRDFESKSHIFDYALRYAASHLADPGEGEIIKQLLNDQVYRQELSQSLWKLLADAEYRRKQIEQLGQYAYALSALQHGIRLYADENQKRMTPEHIGRLAWLVLKFGETGEQSRTDVAVAWQRAREGRMAEALQRLEFVDEEYFFRAALYLLWIESDRMRAELGEQADYSELPEEKTGPFIRNARLVLDAMEKKIPSRSGTVDWGKFATADFMAFWCDRVLVIPGMEVLRIVRHSGINDMSEVAKELAIHKHYNQALQVADSIEANSKALLEIAKAMAAKRHYEQALQVADSIEYALDKFRALLEIAKVTGEKHYYEQALQVGRSIDDWWDKSTALRELAKALTEKLQYEQALQVANSIEYDLDKFRALLEIAKATEDKQHYEQAMQVAYSSEYALQQIEVLLEIAKATGKHQYYEQALRVSIGKEHPTDKFRALMEIAKATGEKHYYEQALQVGRSIDNWWDKSTALRELAKALTEKQQYEQALQVANSTENVSHKSWVLFEIAKATGEKHYYEQVLQLTPSNRLLLEIAKTMAKEKDYEQALRAAYDITEPWYKCKALLKIAKATGEKQHYEQALYVMHNPGYSSLKSKALIEIAKNTGEKKHYEQALQLVEGIGDQKDKSEALLEISKALIEKQDYEQALRVARGIDDGLSMLEALFEIAKALAAKQDYAQAIQLAEIIDYGGYKSSALLEITKAMAAKAHYEQALQLVEGIEDQKDKSEALLEIAKATEEKQHYEQALRVAHSIEHAYHKSYALCEIAKALAEKQHFEHALQVAHSIKTIDEKIDALIEIAKCTGEEQHYKQVIKLMHSNKHEHTYRKSEALCKIVKALAEKHCYEQALQMANGVKDTRYKSASLLEIAKKSGNRQLYDEVLQTASSVPVQNNKTGVLTDFVQSIQETEFFGILLQWYKQEKENLSSQTTLKLFQEVAKQIHQVLKFPENLEVLLQWAPLLPSSLEVAYSWVSALDCAFIQAQQTEYVDSIHAHCPQLGLQVSTRSSQDEGKSPRTLENALAGIVDAKVQTKLETWLDLVREGELTEDKFWAKRAKLLEEHGLNDPLADSHQ